MLHLSQNDSTGLGCLCRSVYQRVIHSAEYKAILRRMPRGAQAKFRAMGKSAFAPIIILGSSTVQEF